MQTQIDRGYLAPETRAAAIRYITRTGNADVLEALGLVADPVAAERTAAKARAMFNGHNLPPLEPGRCPVCDHRLASHGGCNRRKACRKATHERVVAGGAG